MEQSLLADVGRGRALNFLRGVVGYALYRTHIVGHVVHYVPLKSYTIVWLVIASRN
jgi:hypothetical protein